MHVLLAEIFRIFVVEPIKEVNPFYDVPEVKANEEAEQRGHNSSKITSQCIYDDFYCLLFLDIYPGIDDKKHEVTTCSVNLSSSSESSVKMRKGTSVKSVGSVDRNDSEKEENKYKGKTKEDRINISKDLGKVWASYLVPIAVVGILFLWPDMMCRSPLQKWAFCVVLLICKYD